MIEIYSKDYCPYCDRAKQLLKNKGYDFVEYYADQDPDRLKEMLSRCNVRSFPQIFINDHHVGGFDDLYQLDQENKLDPLVKGEKND